MYYDMRLMFVTTNNKVKYEALLVDVGRNVMAIKGLESKGS